MKKLLALNLGVLAVAGLISSALHAQAETITIPAAAQAIINQYAAKGINLCVGVVFGFDENYITLTDRCSATPIANPSPIPGVDNYPYPLYALIKGQWVLQGTMDYAWIKGQWVLQGGMEPVDQGNICNQDIIPFLNKSGGNFSTGVWTVVQPVSVCLNNCDAQVTLSCSEKCPCLPQCENFPSAAIRDECRSGCAQGLYPPMPRPEAPVNSPCMQACQTLQATCDNTCLLQIGGYCSSSLSSALNDSNFINSLPPLPAPAQQQQ